MNKAFHKILVVLALILAAFLLLLLVFSLIRVHLDINISSKNPFYGEYTFHYWLWKNYLDKIETEWVGFCQYRKFFIKDKNMSSNGLIALFLGCFFSFVLVGVLTYLLFLSHQKGFDDQVIDPSSENKKK